MGSVLRRVGIPALTAIARCEDFLCNPASRSGSKAPDRQKTIRRVLLVSHTCYLDAFSPASIGLRAIVECLARSGFVIEVLCGSVLSLDADIDLIAWFTERGWSFVSENPATSDQRTKTATPAHVRMNVAGIPVAIHCSSQTVAHEATESERTQLLLLLDQAFDRLRPEIVIVAGAGVLAADVLAAARARQMVTLLLHNFRQRDPNLLLGTSALLAPSEFAAQFHRDIFGINATVLPPIVNAVTMREEQGNERYVSFIDPTLERGVYVFAKIVEEVSRRRPDIPFLVVEGRGTVATLECCGVDSQAFPNVAITDYATDPPLYWAATKVCLLPWLSWEEYPIAAVEALRSGVPIIASDRGALPEILADGAIILSLPDRLTSVTTVFPTAAEVEPWVNAIIHLWDEPAPADQLARQAQAASNRHDPATLEAGYTRFFNDLKLASAVTQPYPSAARLKSVVLVPYRAGIDPACEQSLQQVEAGGLKVIRRAGCSAIDLARNELISAALLDGYEAMLFIDSDIGFDPFDAYRILARPEPVVAGAYAMKGQRGLAGHFAEGTQQVLFGPEVTGPYPLKYAAAGFLRIKASVLRRLIDELNLPFCNTKWGRGFWPFFLPVVVEQADGGAHYMSEDFAFSHRLGQIGITPVCDTSIRLWHWGQYPYSWEDAGSEEIRHRSFLFLPEDSG